MRAACRGSHAVTARRSSHQRLSMIPGMRCPAAQVYREALAGYLAAQAASKPPTIPY